MQCFIMKQTGGAYGFCDCNVPVCRGSADVPCARLHAGIRASGGLCGVCCDGATSRMHGESAGSRVPRGGAGVAARGADPLHHRRTDGDVADERDDRVLHVLRRAGNSAALVCGMRVCAFGDCVLCHRNEPRCSRYDRHYSNGHCPLRRGQRIRGGGRDFIGRLLWGPLLANGLGGKSGGFAHADRALRKCPPDAADVRSAGCGRRCWMQFRRSFP